VRVPGRYGDGNGLYLQVTARGSKSWIFSFKRNKAKRRQMGLGSVEMVTLAEARDLARQCARAIFDGHDPIERRKVQRAAVLAASAKFLTFREAAEGYIAAHKNDWENPKHRDQWTRTVSAYAYPTIGELDVAAIDTGLVLKCLEPIWQRAPETGSRVRGRIEAVLNWAAARGHRKGENPARWRGHLDHLLGRRPRARHHPALAFADIPAFMADLRQREGIGARALEFLILTASRTNEVIGARWQEIDSDSTTWTIPLERMKARREHKVPLSDRAIAILESLPEEFGDDEAPPARASHGQLSLFPAAEGRPTGFVFVGSRRGTVLSNMSLLQVLRRMGRDELTVHGFRSTFRDWAAETTAFPNHVVEMALAHTVANKAEAAYRRGDLLAKRRRLMADWARYCTVPPAKLRKDELENVTSISRGRRA
jgi:integrase